MRKANNIATLCVLLSFLSTLAFAASPLDKVEGVSLAAEEIQQVREEIFALEKTMDELEVMIDSDAQELQDLSQQQQEIEKKWYILGQDAELSYEAVREGIEEESEPIRERYTELNSRWWQAKRFLNGLEEHLELLHNVLDGSYFTSLYRLREKQDSAQSTEAILQQAKEAREVVSSFMAHQY
ncbi:MAG: hypothetical protein JW869_00870 [Candidatus Omnitrophica bacterium]|nr:hypothetical protein [Candidatus Omnitrophota bacterium]